MKTQKSKKPKKKRNNNPRVDTPRLDREFKTYVLWKSLPPLLKNEIEKRPEIYKNTGFGDNIVIEQLLKIRTQRDFAKTFNLAEDTLSEWNKTIDKRDLLADYRNWAKHLTQNLLMAMYNKGVKYGDPYRVELWLKAIHGWSDKQVVEVEAGKTLADLMREDMQAIRNAKDNNKK